MRRILLLVMFLTLIAVEAHPQTTQTVVINGSPSEALYVSCVSNDYTISKGDIDSGPIMSFATNITKGEMVFSAPNAALDQCLKVGGEFSLQYNCPPRGPMKIDHCLVMKYERTMYNGVPAVRYAYRAKP